MQTLNLSKWRNRATCKFTIRLHSAFRRTTMSIATREELAVYSLDKTAEITGAVFASELGSMAVAVRDDALCGLVFGYTTAAQANAALARVLSIETKSSCKQLVDDDGPASRLLHQLADDLQRYAAG